MTESNGFRKPNVLWICTDQQRYDTIGALGNETIRTPNIDGLVNGGVAFTRAYCQNPICQPSRASFMTGLYPSTLHVNGNGVNTFPENVPLISKLFADAGYRCGLVGKLHLNAAYDGVEKRVDDGYSYWHYSHTPHWQTANDPSKGHDYVQWVAAQGEDLEAVLADPEGVPDRLHHTTWCAEKTKEFMVQNCDTPWFVNLNMFYPHPPFNPPREYLDLYDPDAMPGPLYRESDLAEQKRLDLIPVQREAAPPDQLAVGHREGQTGNYLGGRQDAGAMKAHYYALITHIDDHIGCLLDVLEETGQREHTIVIFTSDHGEFLGDHGLIYKGCRFYECMTRVPLIWNWPGQFESGVQASGLVELIDIAPTLLDLAGLEIPDHMQGCSLRPVLCGDASPDTIREFVRSEYYDAQGGKNRDGKSGFGTMYRDDRYKLVVYHGYDLGELYDLEEDPGEFENRWDDPEFRDLKLDLMKKSFDASMLITDWGGVPVVRRTPGSRF
ncbi:MAG: sulfatase-like hydrolase/transferase [bacterium]|nr:sulfatase-like hydrolase/transferase [bacterium]